jgi:hypothetical protein
MSDEMAPRQVTFEVRHGRLLRHVRLAGGRQYTHACTLAVFEQVAWQVQERPAARVSTGELCKALPALPYTQINVALAFLAERGCLARIGKWSYPQSPTVYEDALENFYYLAEAGPEEGGSHE